MIFVNSAYTQDAGCPIFPIEFVNDIQNLAVHLDFTFMDLNLELYNKIDGYADYGYLKSLFGGYVISFDKARWSSLSDYRFEALPTLKLLICLLNSKAINEDFVIQTINEACEEYGMDFEKVHKLLLAANQILLDFSDSIIGDHIIINMLSLPSVFIGVWLAGKLKAKNRNIKITGTGNQINIPEIGNFLKEAGYIDNFFNSKVQHNPQLKWNEAMERLKDQASKYPLYYGLKIIPYELSHGCPAKCNFCTERLAWSVNGEILDQYRFKDVEECIDEIKYLINEFKISGLTFNDCMLNLKLPRYKKLVNFLMESNLLLSGSMRIDVLDEEMLDLLEKLNFTNLLIGLETLNVDAVNIYNKGNENYTKNAWQMLPELIKRNITPQINFIISHPYESDDDVIKSVSEIERFAKYINEMDVPLVDISAGEILINYPAETYFKVLKDGAFKVQYHDVPAPLEKSMDAKVLECIRKIPYKARKEVKTDINKNQMLKRVQGVKCRDEVVITEACFSVLYRHSEKLLAEWEKFNVDVKLIGKINNPDSNSKYKVLNELYSNTGCASIKHLLDSCGNGNDFVREILILSLLGIIEMEANHYAS
ncbi:MAG: B12-binding domain-containing radical SAM protein [Clostridia bacterium]